MLRKLFCLLFALPFVGFGQTEVFSEDFEYNEKIVQKKWNAEVKPFFEGLRNKISTLGPFTHDKIEEAVKTAMEEHNKKFGEVLPVFRVMLCGTVQGPPIFDVAALLGKEKVTARMDKALQQFDRLS